MSASRSVQLLETEHSPLLVLAAVEQSAKRLSSV